VDVKGGVFEGDTTTYDEITNPAQQLKYILANYAFNAWDGTIANWHDEVSDDSPIHWELFENTEQYFNNRGVKGAIAITKEMTGLALVNLFATEYCPVYWTPAAKLAIKPDDWYFTYDSWMDSRPRLVESEHFLGELTYNYSTEIAADEWSIGFLWSEADNEALERIRVIDDLRNWNTREDIDLKWSPSSL
jgi:hypothetical protein